jgi:hypothetical protein
MTEPDAAGAAPEQELQVVRNDELSRYEGRLAGQLTSVVDFRRRGEVVVVTHTGTEPQWRGRGLAGEITRLALADIRSQGLRVQPVCPYTAAYLDSHPEVADLRA